MACLTKLSSEILLLIAHFAMDGNYWHSLSPKGLSLINKRFNGLAGTFIFADYKLTFRGMRTLNTCRLTGRSTEKWDAKGVRARLAHLRSKAQCVRRLTIVDSGEPLPRGTPGQWQFGRGPPLPDAIVPELLETLQALRSLQSLLFEGYTHHAPRVAFPEALWEWLARRGLREVSFGINFTFGAELGPWNRVGAITIKNFDGGSCHIVQVLRPTELTIEYPRDGKLEKFVPYPGLRMLDVTVPQLFHVRLCKSFFDFIKTPGLEFSVFVGNPREYKLQHMSAWRDLRKSLPVAFHSVDLTQFNVKRTGWTGATISSVKADEKPECQAHIPDPEQDIKEEELQEMYGWRAARKLHDHEA